MEITVKKNCKYQEVLFHDGNARIESGLLSEEESKEYYKQLLQATSEMLWNVGKVKESRIIDKVIDRLSL